MWIASNIKDCVVFIGIKKKEIFEPRATAFVINWEVDGFRFPHIVTAEHVITNMFHKGLDVYIRFNLADGSAFEDKVPPEVWRFHPEENPEFRTDVAIAPFYPQVGMRVVAYPMSAEFVTSDEDIQDSEGNVGREVAIVGLFRSHYGHGKNIPIVRVGNLALVSGEEPVNTKYRGFMEAHLIEARSIGGLSGSPVFLSIEKNLGHKSIKLLGLVHGHFDIKNMNADVAADHENDALGNINTGIGVVVPVSKIVETIAHPDLEAQRQDYIAAHRSRAGAE